MKTKYLKKLREEYCITETVRDIEIQFIRGYRGRWLITTGIDTREEKLKVKQKEYKVYRGLDFITSFKGPECDVSDTWIRINIRDYGYEEYYNKRSLRFAIDRAKELFISSVYSRDKKARKSIDSRKQKITDNKNRLEKIIRDREDDERRDIASQDIHKNKIKWD